MAAINTGIYRHFRNGGVLSFTDNETPTTYSPVNGVDENSLGWTIGMHEVYLDRDNGTLLTSVRRGDEQPSGVRVRFKVTAGMIAAAGLLGLLQDQHKATDDGYVRSFDLLWKMPTLPDGATGVSVAFAGAVVRPGSLALEPGQEYDVVTCEFIVPNGIVTLGTY